MSLHIRDLVVVFTTPAGDVRAIDGLSLSISSGERVALVGESGCGKTVLALSLVGLLPGNARVTGAAVFNGEDLIHTNAARRIRGQKISICWSNAERFFNPVLTVGKQICEAYIQHHPAGKSHAEQKADALLKEMGFSDSRLIRDSYPFQLSGGMNQRAMLAMSVVNDPELLLVDEPTRGLDDASRENVVQCLRRIHQSSMLIITHDMRLVMELAHRVYFMKEGKILAQGPCPQALSHPGHPYAELLIQSDLCLSAVQSGKETHERAQRPD
jgi:ABC-type dipeptide/oligopeptide/nickel transport system ATPase component